MIIKQQVDMIENNEEVFNINNILATLFRINNPIVDEKNIELIYDMAPTIPRKLRGNSDALLKVLTKMLTFVFNNSDKKEFVLSLSAPEDFLYEECVSFEIKETNIPKEKIFTFLKDHLKKDIEVLEGKSIHHPENSSDIHVSIPFRTFELGFRRHYRLPNKDLVGKKLLLFCSSDKISKSLKNMFKYFHYNVDINPPIKYMNDLIAYDIIIIDKNIFTENMQKTIAKVQELTLLKCVLLQHPNNVENTETQSDYSDFIKPITQEKILDLIVSLFDKTANTNKVEEISL